jgi:indole-3-glycerol phosphate synthase
MSILDEIFEHKRAEVASRRAAVPLQQLRAAAESCIPALDFVDALSRRHATTGRPALIAEVKQRSPSRGVLVQDFDPLVLARIYADNGAAAISVLTDERYFGGSLDDLREIAAGPGFVHPPLLRKDFVCDPYQLYEARVAGADAVLLIAGALPAALLRELLDLARVLGLAALVEVHDRAELDRALACSPALVGINNRDLRDFSVNLATTLDLRPYVPPGVIVVAESGIRGSADLDRLAEAGVHAVLIGEGLVTAPDVAQRVREFTGITIPAGK